MLHPISRTATRLLAKVRTPWAISCVRGSVGTRASPHYTLSPTLHPPLASCSKARIWTLESVGRLPTCFPLVTSRLMLRAECARSREHGSKQVARSDESRAHDLQWIRRRIRNASREGRWASTKPSPSRLCGSSPLPALGQVDNYVFTASTLLQSDILGRLVIWTFLNVLWRAEQVFPFRTVIHAPQGL
jgi:hypothetical protein